MKKQISELDEKILQAKKKMKRNLQDSETETEVEYCGLQLAKLNFLLTGKLSQAKKTKGIRAILYRLASSCLGYYDEENDAFWYQGDDLMIRLLFKSEDNADFFHRRVNDELFYQYPEKSKLVLLDVYWTRTANVVGKPILGTDYRPDENDELQDVDSSESGNTSVLDSSTPLFKFQRIESDSVFGKHYKAKSYHLIDDTYFANNPQEEDDIENNRLALSADVYSWFHGRNVDVPLFKLTISETHPISCKPVIEDRYQVPLLVQAIDSDAARLLFPRLQEGTIFFTDQRLEAIVKVYVLDPKVFAACIKWKASETQKAWDEYHSMESAVM